MNTPAIKKMAITNALSGIPDDKLDEIQEFIKSILTESGMLDKNHHSLQGIWSGKGFEKIINLDEEIEEIRNKRVRRT